MSEVILKLFLGIFFLYALFCALYYFLQKRMIFFPDQTAFSRCGHVQRDGGEAIEEGSARYYMFKSRQSKTRAIVIHFHGNGGRACDRYPYLKELRELGFHLALAEYPGYAQDTTLPGQDKILRHAKAVVESAKNKYPGMPLVFFGESLGAAVATWLGTQFQPGALILQTPFESLGEVGKHHYPWLPARAFLRHPFPANKWAGNVKAPVFVFHGEEDEIIPFKMGKRQFENFDKGSKNLFWTVSGARHNDILLHADAELWKRVDGFLNSAGI